MEKPEGGVVTMMGMGIGVEAKGNDVGIETGVAGVISERAVGAVEVMGAIAGVISERVVGTVGVMGVIVGMIDAKAGVMEGRGSRKEEEDGGVTTDVVRGRGKRWLHRRALRQRSCRWRKAWMVWRRRSWQGGAPTPFLIWPSLCSGRGSDSM